VIVPSYHYMIGPTAALLALGVIVLICRWTFSTTGRDTRAARRLQAARASAASRGDYGLLVRVASAPSEADAEQLRGRLRDAGVRATVARETAEGTCAVLVFQGDAERARSLVD
jgi:hypothetical protein